MWAFGKAVDITEQMKLFAFQSYRVDLQLRYACLTADPTNTLIYIDETACHHVADYDTFKASLEDPKILNFWEQSVKDMDPSEIGQVMVIGLRLESDAEGDIEYRMWCEVYNQNDQNGWSKINPILNVYNRKCDVDNPFIAQHGPNS